MNFSDRNHLITQLDIALIKELAKKSNKDNSIKHKPLLDILSSEFYNLPFTKLKMLAKDNLLQGNLLNEKNFCTFLSYAPIPSTSYKREENHIVFAIPSFHLGLHQNLSINTAHAYFYLPTAEANKLQSKGIINFTNKYFFSRDQDFINPHYGEIQNIRNNIYDNLHTQPTWEGDDHHQSAILRALPKSEMYKNVLKCLGFENINYYDQTYGEDPWYYSKLALNDLSSFLFFQYPILMSLKIKFQIKWSDRYFDQFNWPTSDSELILSEPDTELLDLRAIEDKFKPSLLRIFESTGLINSYFDKNHSRNFIKIHEGLSSSF